MISRELSEMHGDVRNMVILLKKLRSSHDLDCANKETVQVQALGARGGAPEHWQDRSVLEYEIEELRRRVQQMERLLLRQEQMKREEKENRNPNIRCLPMQALGARGGASEDSQDILGDLQEQIEELRRRIEQLDLQRRRLETWFQQQEQRVTEVV